MADFVINEWFWADLAGNNSKRSQIQSLQVIEKLPHSDHRIVIIEGSAFDQKAWRLCKNSNPAVQRIGGMFVVAIRQDSNNCLLLKPEQTNIPPELEQKIKPDDRYLIEAQQRVEGATIVTTDAPLREALNEVGRRFSSREEFLNLIRIF